MVENSNVSLPTTDVIRTIGRQKKKVLLFALATMAMTAAVVLFWPATYESEAKLFVRLGRENVSLDPTATTGQVVSIEASRELEMQSVVEMLSSRFVIERAVERLGPETVLNSGTGSAMSNYLGSFVGGIAGIFGDKTADDAKAKEAAIRRLANAVRVGIPNRSAVVTVSCQATTPEFAQMLASTVVDVYMDEHARLNRTEKSDQFFAEQADLLEEQLQVVAKELRDAKNEKGVVSVESQLLFLEEQKAKVEEERLRNRRQLSEAKARRQSLEETLKNVEPTRLASKVDGLPNVAADDMRQQLYALEIKERELLARHPDTHPLVVALRKQVETVREIYADEVGDRSQTTYETNPTYTALDMALSQCIVDMQGYEALDASLNGQYEAIVSDLRDLNEYSVRMKDLELKQEMLVQSYRTYAEKLEQARIGTALDEEQITNVNVAQRAPLVLTAASPNKKMVAGLGLLLAIFGGIGLGLYAEQFDQRLSSPAEVEAALSLPVVASVPRSVHHGRQKAEV